MKLSALQQIYLNRRSNSLRGSPPFESSGEISGKSPAEIFLLLIHVSCCVVSVLLGFRFSRLAFFFLFSSSTNHHAVPFVIIFSTQLYLHNHISGIVTGVEVVRRVCLLDSPSSSFRLLYLFRWIIDPPLDITVASKRTPWPDTPSELPITEKVLAATQEQTAKHSTKPRTSRSSAVGVRKSMRPSDRCASLNTFREKLRDVNKCI